MHVYPPRPRRKKQTARKESRRKRGRKKRDAARPANPPPFSLKVDEGEVQSAVAAMAQRGQQQQQQAAATPAAPLAEAASPTQASLQAEGEPNDGVAAAPSAAPSTAQPAVPSTAETTRPMLRIPGASFLRQWQAGLTGAAEGPSAEQIAELTGIFPHHTRQAIVTALQQNDLSTTRAAETLLTAGSA